MLLRLEEINPGKTLTRDLEFDRETIETLMGEVTLKDIRATLDVRVDPMGHVIHSKAAAHAVLACIRCGNPVEMDIEVDDWISLRTTQPEDPHVVLDGSEMNVRFQKEPVLDLKAFVLETIEMELPDFPRHDEDDPACQSAVEAAGNEEESSPFGVLSKYLDQ